MIAVKSFWLSGWGSGRRQLVISVNISFGDMA
jgi:hypothetical protein